MRVESQAFANIANFSIDIAFSRDIANLSIDIACSRDIVRCGFTVICLVLDTTVFSQNPTGPSGSKRKVDASTHTFAPFTPAFHPQRPAPLQPPRATFWHEAVTRVGPFTLSLQRVEESKRFDVECAEGMELLMNTLRPRERVRF